ncbi:aminodeoxychorismate synthase, component I [Cytobacillus solani]|uniref:Aminobenzoate synthetase n=1 Tax=Cytobacillus solani TaxID=1637975 RepID=A0A0Q3VNJ3_9BACI|nr:aminodeoxychorismate synthase, component I [Cytobacillus solani]KOP70396.1 aminobenzoate synthetase [Bacillus sp. FJAT-21945]KQL27418.1 aminobenzoate synthetase [Cytobacillus solani]
MKKYHLHAKKIPYTYNRLFPQYRKISLEKEHHILLESGRGGRYSIAAFDPETVLIGKNSKLEVIHKEGRQTLEGNPLHLFKDWLSQYEAERYEEFPDFQGGAIGLISYDYGRYIEKLPELARDDLQMPDIHFLVFKEWFVFDHQAEVLWLMFLYEQSDEREEVENRAENWKRRWIAEYALPNSKNATEISTQKEVSMSEEIFIQAVQRVQHYISQGDVFQVNLSVRQSQPISLPALDVYEKLRELNPSPYMGYIQTPEYQLVSASPELLIKKKGKEVSTRPIAGTRSRGKDESEDLELANELIENEKERAEHVMLVDLERNDLGRVCTYGSVEVDEFMVIEKYSHVMHIVSNVRGELADGKDGFDLIDAVFPGGTITGAPKIRTMEIIEELEPVTRGPYTGSFGWINFNGDLELNIIIRTMLVKDGFAHVQAGAGVVIDSNPVNEYKESLKKAIALWMAKEMAEQEKGD